MQQFEEVLKQYEPMISATLRKLNIYKNHEQFTQASRIALWLAWTRYDEEKGHFAPFAARTIRGAMLDVLKQETRFEENIVQTEDEILVTYVEKEAIEPIRWSEKTETVFEQLTKREKQLIHWLFVEGFTQKECAEKAGISAAGIKKRRERLFIKLRAKMTP